MNTPRTKSEHACLMPEPTKKHEHAIYACDCGCGWRAAYDFHQHRSQGMTWKWVQVL